MFEEVSVAFPVVPDDTPIVSRPSPSYVSPIQVTLVTAFKPPGTPIDLGTATVAGILISVPGRKSLTTVEGKAVTWKDTGWLYYSEIIN